MGWLAVLFSSKMAPRIFIFSIVPGAEYLFYVKFIASYAPTFFEYIISVLASVIFVKAYLIGVTVFKGRL
jgi:hypothetical protein